MDSDKPNLRIKNIEISKNIFYNSDCMASIYPFSMVYSDFIINDNGDPVEQDTTESIFKIQFNPQIKMQFENLEMIGNNVGLGSVFEFELLTDPDQELDAEDLCQDDPNIII